MNLSVIQTENLENDPAGLGCYISVDDQLIDIITPLGSNSHESSTEIPKVGRIQFIIKDMRKDEILGTFTENIKDLPKEGSHWFSLESTFKHQAKILIVFNSSFYKPVSSFSNSEKEELNNKINELQTIILELEYKLGQEKEHKNLEINTKNKILSDLQQDSELTFEQYKIKLNNALGIISLLETQKNEILSLSLQEHEKNRVLENKFFEIKMKNAAVLEKIKANELEFMKESFMLQEELRKTKEILNNELCQKNLKEILISQLSFKLNNAKNNETEPVEFQKKEEILTKQLQLSEKIRNNLQNSIKDYENQELNKVCENCKDFQSKILFLTEELHKSHQILSETKADSYILSDLQEKAVFQDNEIQCLLTEIQGKNQKILSLSGFLSEKASENENLLIENKEITQNCSELKQRILKLTKNIEILEKDLTELKCRNMSAKKLKKIRLDEVDFLLENYLSEQKIENLFVKMAHGVYLYGTKKVSITICNDNTLICRIGGGYLPIDQFLKLYQNTDIEEISKYVKKQSLFLSQGSSPIRALHRRALSNTPENSSRKVSPKENATERNFENKIIGKLRGLYVLKDRNTLTVKINEGKNFC